MTSVFLGVVILGIVIIRPCMSNIMNYVISKSSSALKERRQTNCPQSPQSSSEAKTMAPDLAGTPPRGDYAVIRRTYCDLLYQELKCMPIMLADHARDAHQASHSLYRRSEKNLRVCKALHQANQVPLCHSKFLLIIHD